MASHRWLIRRRHIWRHLGLARHDCKVVLDAAPEHSFIKPRVVLECLECLWGHLNTSFGLVRHHQRRALYASKFFSNSFKLRLWGHNHVLLSDNPFGEVRDENCVLVFFW